MSHRSIAPQINCTPELASIIANASFLWERLDSARFTADNQPHGKPEIDRRLNHWCHIVAQDNWDTLQKRLEWEGSNLDTIHPLLGNVRLTIAESLPEWAETLQQIIQTATDFTSASESFLPIEADNPIVFEDVLLPAIIVARQQLLTRLGSRQLTADRLPLSMLCADAYRALERSLLQRLSELCAKTLNFEFSQVRPFGESLLNLLGLEPGSSNRKTHYTQFVDRLLQEICSTGSVGSNSSQFLGRVCSGVSPPIRSR
jgi:hypothetical protein